LKPKSGFGIKIKCAIALLFLWFFNIVIISVNAQMASTACQRNVGGVFYVRLARGGGKR
jgi:hypothetical protein